LKIFIDNNYEGYTPSTSPDINLDVVHYLKENFDSLTKEYEKNISTNEPKFNTSSNFLRDDYKYLHLLWKAYSSGQQTPNITFVLPPVSQARWNSRATFFFMAWYLTPQFRPKIQNVMNFLSSVWAPNWFLARSIKLNFREISEVVDDDKLKSFFVKHYVETHPTLNVPMTNEVAERALGNQAMKT